MRRSDPEQGVRAVSDAARGGDTSGSLRLGRSVSGGGGLLGRLRLVPQFVHFGQARILGRFSVRRQRTLDRGKAPLKLEVRFAQYALRVGAQMPGKINNGEEKVTDLSSHLDLIAAIEFGLDLGRLLANLGEDGPGVIPVETDVPSLVLELQGAG